MDDWDRPVSEEERNAALARLGAFMDKMAKAGITEEELQAALAEAEEEAQAEYRAAASRKPGRKGSAPRRASALTQAR